jgi:hypothetical protein
MSLTYMGKMRYKDSSLLGCDKFFDCMTTEDEGITIILNVGIH